MNRHLNLTTESDIEKYLAKGVERLGGKCLKFVSPGYPGVFDRITFMSEAYVFLIECKRPKGGVYSALQLNTHKLFTDMGFSIYKLHTKEQVDEFLNFIETFC